MRIASSLGSWISWAGILGLVLLLSFGALAGTAVKAGPQAPSVASPVSGAWTAGFNQPGFDNGVTAVVEDVSGDLYVGGAFTRVWRGGRSHREVGR